LQSFRDLRLANVVGGVQIGDRSRHSEHAMDRPTAEMKALGGKLEKLSAHVVENHISPQERRAQRAV
jgi:hypothetical protein